MPKDTSNRYISHKTRDYSYKPYTSHGKAPAVSQGNLNEDDSSLKNDWQDVTCPICMETPHNAVLLRCSSYTKGCRPYMCDTSYRHSNCLDQYCKAHTAGQKAYGNWQGSALVEAADSWHRSSTYDADNNTFVRVSQRPRDCHMASTSEQGGSLTAEDEFLEDTDGCRTLQLPRVPSGVLALQGRDLVGLLCPLCRGHVKGWEVIKAARSDMNKESRNCAWEACSFTGSYEELRTHARCDHPAARPAEIDPARERDWRRLERQRDLGDVLSTIQSAMPGATVLGDYVIDGQEDPLDNYDSEFPNDVGHPLTVFLLFQVFGPSHSFMGGRLLPHFRGVVRGRNRTGSTRQGLWGEILQQTLSNEGNSSLGSSDYGEIVAGSSSQRQQRSQRR